MPVEDLLRDLFAREADSQPPPTGLYQRALKHGARLRRRRRAGQIAGVAVIAGAAAAVAILGPGWRVAGHRVPGPVAPQAPRSQTASPSPNPSPPEPWWQSWPAGRSYGTPPSPAFLAALDPGARVRIYADGTLPDGEEFAMYLDPATGDAVQYTQGWAGSPDYGTGASSADPRMTDFVIQLASTAAVHSSGNNSTWAIVVGRPGTTAIDYSIDGGRWQPMPVSNGIGVLARTNGKPSGTVSLRLIDSSGQYAQDSFQQFAPPAPSGPAQSSSPATTASSPAPACTTRCTP